MKDALAEERITFRLQPENAKRLARFMDRYPTEVRSKIINKALAEWFKREERKNGKES